MHFAEVVNFTQLNLVQVAAQGYTAETEKKLSDTPSPAESSQQTKPNGHLSLVANTSLENREIDHELVLRAQRGDKRAFSMLVDKYQRKLARLLSRMVRDQSEIEDIVQDTFIKAYRALPYFRGDSAFYTWL